MACTTILVGKNASYDGSTMIARNDDSGAGHFTAKKFTVVHPAEMPKTYRSVLSHVEVPLPEGALRFTAMPNAVEGKGIWAAGGVNAANVGMTATETITSNPRVLGADPLVPGGIGEEDIVYLTLPYIHTAREGVQRLGGLLETYGTYEMNGIAFQDVDEIWWLETIGGHHWIDDADHVYNTPRAWWMLRHLNPTTWVWDGPDADYGPRSDDLPWCMVPEKKITPEEVKYVLSGHYQGTPYDPYLTYGDKGMKGAYRSIGINRNDFMALLQMRPDVPEASRAIEWIAYASNAFNTMVPFYANVERTPEYLANTTGTVSTDNFYWVSRMIAAMTDASYNKSLIHIERYAEAVVSAARAILNEYDAKLAAEPDAAKAAALRVQANNAIAAMLKEKASDTLDKVLFELSSQMKNAYSRSDA